MQKKLDTVLPHYLLDREQILSTLPGGAYWKDLQGRYLACNKEMANMLGLSSPDEIVGKTDYELCWHNYAERISQNDKIVIEEGKTLRIQEKIITYDNKIIDLFSNKSPLRDTNSKVVGVVGISVNITIDQIKKSSANSEHDYIRSILDSTPGLVYWKDKNSRYLGANMLCLRQLGLEHIEDIVGKVDEELWGKEKAEALRENDRHVLETGNPIIFEEPTTINGQDIIYMAAKMPLRDENNNIIGVIGTSVDITELKQTQAALEHEKLRAESANMVKSEFLATMSHELRTPLNAILGMSQVLQSRDINRELKEFVDIIYQASSNLLSLINDILDFAKLDAGSLTLISSPFDLRFLLEEVVRNYHHSAKEKGIELIMDYDPYVPHKLMGDAKRVRQILVNLINNAIKFTEKGYVLVSVECTEKVSDENIVLQIAVEDTGLGIEKENIDKIFERFTQVDSTYSRKYEGTGLGLAITKEIVEMMSGSIGINSQFNKGSTFWCNIPFIMQSGTKQHLRWDEYEDDIYILVVTDHETRSRIICKQFGEYARHTRAVNAIDTLIQSQKEKQSLSIIIIDQQITSMCPLALAKEIKHHKQLNKVMLTALTRSASKDNLSRLHDAGYFTHIEKPLQPSDFLRRLSKAWQSWHKLQYNNPNEINTHEMNVLLVEDNLLNQKVAKLMLESYGCKVDVAISGEEALQILSEDHDLVFMDIGLPGKNGLEVTHEIRERDSAIRGVPIIAMTAHVLKADRDKAFEAGMSDIITKPILQDQLRRLLNQWRDKI